MSTDVELEWPEEPDFVTNGFDDKQIDEFRRQSAERFIEKIAQMDQDGMYTPEFIIGRFNILASPDTPAVDYLGKATKSTQLPLSLTTILLLWILSRDLYRATTTRRSSGPSYNCYF